MSYLNYHNNNNTPNHLQARVKQLETQKSQLISAIQELNVCYQEKIHLLESTISQQQQRYEELLEWKQSYIDRNLFEVEKYQMQLKKMIDILDNAHRNFQMEKAELIQGIKEQKIEIDQLRIENESLNQFNLESEAKIQELVHTYTEQIEKLKHELKNLRDESMMSDESSQQPLRSLRNISNNENMEPNEKTSESMFSQKDPSFSKFSVTTIIQ